MDSLTARLNGARLLARLQHRHIVAVYDVQVIGDDVVIAMECLDGVTLAEVIREGRLSIAERIQVLIEILDALDYVHRQRVIYGDVSPANVQVLSGGTSKLIDFDLAHEASGLP